MRDESQGKGKLADNFRQFPILKNCSEFNLTILCLEQQSDSPAHMLWNRQPSRVLDVLLILKYYTYTCITSGIRVVRAVLAFGSQQSATMTRSRKIAVARDLCCRTESLLGPATPRAVFATKHQPEWRCGRHTYRTTNSSTVLSGYNFVLTGLSALAALSYVLIFILYVRT